MVGSRVARDCKQVGQNRSRHGAHGTCGLRGHMAHAVFGLRQGLELYCFKQSAVQDLVALVVVEHIYITYRTLGHWEFFCFVKCISIEIRNPRKNATQRNATQQ